MDLKEFKPGVWVQGNGHRYFLPEPVNHGWTLSDPATVKALESASLRLGELNSLAKFVPDVDLFIQSYVMKEAVTSSRIEGTKTDMEEAFTDEADVHPERRNDWHETQQYRKAMNFAVAELERLPVSNRLLRSVHKVLLSQARGKHKNPGEFRTTQNWIGGTSLSDAAFVPPAAHHLGALLGDLEKFLNDREMPVPHLVRIAIAHYQFETIHPFLDGNGRVGRVLIPLHLVSVGVLEKPLLYVSAFFERHKALYYDKLTFVRERGDLAGWVAFFLRAVEETSAEALKSLREILGLKKRLSEGALATIGKRSASANVLLDALFRKPVISVAKAAQAVGLSVKAANDLVAEFERLGILSEITGNKRNRLFAFWEYMKILKK